MSDYIRTFPRFSVIKSKKFNFKIEGLTSNFAVHDISLGGIGLYSEIEIKNNQLFKCKLVYGSNEIFFEAQIIWVRKLTYEGKDIFRMGCSLFFTDWHEFEFWKKLILGLEKS